MVKALTIVSLFCLIYTCSFHLETPEMKIEYEKIKSENEKKENKIKKARITAINTAVRGVLIK